MPTTYTDQAFLMDPGVPPAVGTVLDFSTISILDNNDNGIISPAGTLATRDQVQGSPVTRVYNGDTITVQLPGGDVVTITGVTFYTSAGGRFFTPTDGTILQNGSIFLSSTFVPTSTSVPVSALLPICFTPGTLILTPEGEVPVEALQVGDLVVTRDRGPQPLRWIGRRRFPGTGRYAPIRLDAGVVGNRRELRVSPQHRFLIDDWRAELFFGEDEVLVAACHLVNDQSVRPAPCPTVDYLHLLFDGHEIIFAEGAATESFHPGDWVLGKDAALRDELADLFPELDAAGPETWPTVRPVAPGVQAKALSAVV
jgi:hypothetical protein